MSNCSPREEGDFIHTKERILVEAMKLFSVSGYEAVTVRAIADAVGVGNSALYKHYKNKQEIFDAIVVRCRERFIEKCGEVNEIALSNETEWNPKKIGEICFSMFQFQTEDEWIVRFRRILLMEQFRNPEMAKVYKDFFIESPIQNQVKLFQYLMDEGFIKKRDPQVLAMEMYAPFYLHHLDTANTDEEQEKLKKQYQLHLQYYFEDNAAEKEGKL